MIEFYKRIFTKPTYHWKTIEIMAVLSLVGLLCLIGFCVWLGIKAIINHHKDKQYRTCAQNDCTRFIATCKKCKKYKSKKGKE